MKTTVVIPVYNGEPFLAACLNALQAQSVLPEAIIAVDNGSSDAGRDLIATEFPAVTLLTFDAPLGFAGACNRGIAAALAADPPPDVIVILNQDTVVDTGWLAALLAPLAADPQIGVVGSLARFPDGTLQHAGAALTDPLHYGYNLAAGATSMPCELPPAEYMAALATALRCEMLAAIGWFDEAFFPAYFEDADLCLRARNAGWKLHLAHDATLVHHEGAGGGPRHAAMIERNRWRLLLKHTPPETLLGVLGAAERAHAAGQARLGTSQRLRHAYLHALDALPAIATQRGWDAATRDAVADLLVALRNTTTIREHDSRMYGLGVAGSTRMAEPPHYPYDEPVAPGNRRPPVAIIIRTWNGLAVTQACLESLRSTTQAVDYRIIVVDNGSSDGSAEWLAAQPDITLIANRENVGYTRGNNQGFALVPDDHDVLLLNNDTLFVHPHWLAHMRDVAHSHPQHGVVGCLLLHGDGRLQHAGAAMPTDTFWGYQIGGGERYIGQYPGVREVESITGACMYIRADLRMAIGGLDEDFFSYYEDTDYCLRARAAGYKVVCTGGAQVIHLENTSSRINRADWRAMFGRAQHAFLAKWRSRLTDRYQRAITWCAPGSGASPAAQLTRGLVGELDRLAIDVRLTPPGNDRFAEPETGDPRIDQLRRRPADPALPLIACAMPQQLPPCDNRRMGFVLIDCDGVAAERLAYANQFEQVLATDDWSAEVLMSAGVSRPISVIAPGVDHNFYHPAIVGRKPSRRCVFLALDTPGARLDLATLLHAYHAAFSASDDVLLLLLVPSTATATIAAAHQGSAAVAVLPGERLPAYQRGSLYRSADCFVLPHRGIAWGGTIREALACGLPVIATDWGVARANLPAGASYPLQVRGLAGTPRGECRPIPDSEHLTYLLRSVYEFPAAAQATGRAGGTTAAQWTWAAAARTIRAQIESDEFVA
ncbi:MAG TPA: glycosyltransferase [Roseiflexaceae bacterium]|nr:glycosyltransferase [Roseiflexaceae bacterium]